MRQPPTPGVKPAAKKARTETSVSARRIGIRDNGVTSAVGWLDPASKEKAEAQHPEGI